MKVEKNKIKLKTNDWIFKIRNEGRRMKIYIKLNQSESGQWGSIKTAVLGKGSKMEDGEFAKIMMFRGLNSFMDDVNKAIDDMTDEEKEKVLADAGAGKKTEALDALGVDKALEMEDEVEIVVPNVNEIDENTTKSDG